MFYLLVILSLLSMGTGVFVVGFGVPIRETIFGAGLLVAGAVAITGGFLLVGLAAAIAELQLMVKALRARVPAVPRPLRPVDRKEGVEKRPMPPRMPVPPRPGAEAPAAPPPAPSLPFPQQAEAEVPPPGLPPIPALAGEAEPVRRTPRPEWLRRAMAEIEQGPEPPDAGPPRWSRAPERPAPDTFEETEAHDRDAQDHYETPETRPPLPSAPPIAPSRFDAIWPSDRRRGPEPPEKRSEPDFSPPGRQFDRRPPPLVPPLMPPPPAPLPPPPTPAVESAPARGDNREATILKSGMIDEMSYTLFTDGSIEAQMPDGTMRFASIDELRRHLEQQGE